MTRDQSTFAKATADKRWKLGVLERGNWTCRVGDCGANTNLDAAHIKYGYLAATAGELSAAKC